MPTELAADGTTLTRCPGCGAQLLGESCHTCGQRRFGARLSRRAQALGYLLLAVVVGLEQTAHWMLPPLRN
jgi:hypothetical protein